MVKAFLSFCLSLPMLANSNMGTVVVLEASLFDSPNLDSKIIEYKRKGDQLVIHPHYFKKKTFNIKETNKNINDFPDPLFTLKNQRQWNNDFFLTLSKSGKEVYVQKNSIHLNFNDKRELLRKENKIDYTDYRITEPLPRDYPIKIKTGYRGAFSIALGNTVGPSYQYGENIQKSTPGLYKDFNFTWSKKAEIGTDDHLYYGGVISLNMQKSEYELNTYNASESSFNLGIGPLISYDILTYENSFFSISFATPIYFIKSLTVKLDASSGDQNERIYSSFSVSPQLDLTYNYLKAVYELDLIAGIRIQTDLFNKYSLKSDSSDQGSLWTDSDFNQSRRIQLSYFAGLQTNY